MRFLALGLFFASTMASATTFEFVPNEKELIPVFWHYREAATRTVIGCRQWDVLQGSGWFQATWHFEYVPSFENGVYTVTHKSKLAAKICAAKLDQYNGVRVEYGDLRGSFTVNPDGFASETTINCRFNPEGSEYDSLSCDEAHVSTQAGTVRIYMNFTKPE